MKMRQTRDGIYEVLAWRRSKKTMRKGWHVVFKSDNYKEALAYLRANRPNPCQA